MDPFEDCVAKGRLKQVEPDAERVATELSTAKEELERGRACYIGGNWDEAVTQAYFAMCRCARAAVNARGYRDTNLYGLCAALEKLLVEKGDLPKDTVKQLRDAKDVKDVVYNGHRATAQNAADLLTWAQVIAKAVFTLVSLPGFDADTITTVLPEPPEPGRTRTKRPTSERFGRREWPGPRRYRA